MTDVCSNPSQTSACEWTLGYFWHWMNWQERLDLIVLAFLLAYIVVVVVYISYRYYSLCGDTHDSAFTIFQRTREQRIAELGIALSNLKSIAFAAPYLGLAGTCAGIFGAFRGISMERASALGMISAEIATALLVTAAGILVAVPAVVSYNLFKSRIQSLESKIPCKPSTSGSPRITRKFALQPRFSQVPYAMVAASVLAVSITAFMTFSWFQTPVGLSVRLAEIGASEKKHSPSARVVIEIRSESGKITPTIYVNSKRTESEEFEKRLGSEFKSHSQGPVCVQAEDSVSWRDVANVIDVAKKSHENVILFTPFSSCARASPKTVERISRPSSN